MKYGSNTVWKSGALIAGLLLWTLTVSAQVSSLFGEVQLKDAVIPVFVRGQQQAAAVIHVERTLTDYQVRGFFRIGVLPVAVADGVVIAFRDPAAVAEALMRAHGWLQPPGGGRSVELRRVVFRMPEGAGTNRLEVGLVRLGSTGQWKLTGGVAWHTAAGAGRLESAMLQVTGTHSGRLAGTESALPDFFKTTVPPVLSKPDFSLKTQANPQEIP